MKTAVQILASILVLAISILTQTGSSDGGAECGRHKSPSKARILGGLLAQVGDFPSAMSLRVIAADDTFESCTAVLIRPNLILTAAHCLHSPTIKKVEARSGPYFNANNDWQYQAKSYCLAPDYESAISPSDHAVVVLKSNASLDDRTQIACLADRPLTEQDQLYVLGAGLDHTGLTSKFMGYFRARKLPIPKGVLSSPNTYCYVATETCAGTTFGDSGGPILADIGGKHTLFGLNRYAARVKYPGNGDNIYSCGEDVFQLRDEINTLIDDCLKPDSADVPTRKKIQE